MLSAVVDAGAQPHWPVIDFAVSAHELQRLECQLRVEVCFSEEQARLDFSAGSPTCPPPDTRAIFARVFERQRAELLINKYDDLVTRQFLRDERWLEFTLLLLQGVNEDEAKVRDAIAVEEALAAAQFDLIAAHLALLCVQGTEGTVVYVEELEREVRFHGVCFDEVREREEIGQRFIDELGVVIAIEDRRREGFRRLFASLVDDEWQQRYSITEDEGVEFFPFEKAEAQARENVRSLLLWRVVVLECDVRLDLENDYEALLGFELERLHRTFLATLPPPAPPAAPAANDDTVVLQPAQPALHGDLRGEDRALDHCGSAPPPAMVEGPAMCGVVANEVAARRESQPLFAATDEVNETPVAVHPRLADEEVAAMWKELERL